MSKDARKTEFGDFQTPLPLARAVCQQLLSAGISPATVVEPNCGVGAFLQAASETFRTVKRLVGRDIETSYLTQAIEGVASTDFSGECSIESGDFFEIDWQKLIESSAGPVLFLGNPPWVTNSSLGALQSGNLPLKQNRDGLRGLDAMTGKSNFDISEWMIGALLKVACKTDGSLAILCKTMVARKVLLTAWKNGWPVGSSEIRLIDAKSHFNAAVDACLLIVQSEKAQVKPSCQVFESIEATQTSSHFGIVDGLLVANVESFQRWSHLFQESSTGWRSGIKHDCSKVFEFTRRGDRLLNGLDETCQLDEETLFPLLKSSDLANGRTPRKKVLVTNRTMQEDPASLRKRAPDSWRYLEEHSAQLEARRSSIYTQRPPYSIFGIGDYTFSPWKVAIAGLYKRLHFSIVGPIDSKPVLFDDTCYFFACETEEEAEILLAMLDSEPAREFFASLIFWDAKRPITAKILNALDLSTLQNELKLSGEVVDRLVARQHSKFQLNEKQKLLFT